MNIKTTISIIAFALLALLNTSCSRKDFLDAKPHKSLVVPNTLEQFQMVLDHDLSANGTGSQGVTPQLGESGSDNYYLMPSDFHTYYREQMQNYYLWSAQPYVGENVLDWQSPYRAILNANTVIAGLENIERNDGNKDIYDNLKGQALFHRAYMYHQLAQIFAPPYNPNSDNSELGIILRLEADINENLTRATVQETYNQIIADLTEAIELLLDNNPAHKGRASRQAAYGLMARVYLTMHDYSLSKAYANFCLEIQDELYDYNLVDTSAQSPFQGVRFEHPINQEIIFFTAMLTEVTAIYPINPFFARIDTVLYNSYQEGDLRKKVFFQPIQNGYRFKGSYSFVGYDHYFSGLAVDEILLIRAECNARLGNTADALDDLNKLLISRWDNKVVYEPYDQLNSEETLGVILQERRKELVYRGLRWSDLRRLNQEGHGITLERNLDGQVHTLPPHDPRWTWPLPLEVLAR